MKRFLALLLALMMLMSLTACGGNSGDGKDNDDGGKTPTQTELPKIKHEKTYAINEPGDDYYITVEVGYREGSNKVARISGEMRIPSSHPNYEELKAEAFEIEEKVKEANKSDDIQYFNPSEIKTAEPVFSINFYFSELDASNAESIELVAELLGMTLTNGELLVDDCDEFLTGIGMTLEYDS